MLDAASSAGWKAAALDLPGPPAPTYARAELDRPPVRGRL